MGRILQTRDPGRGPVAAQLLAALRAVPGEDLVLTHAKDPLHLQDKQNHRHPALVGCGHTHTHTLIEGHPLCQGGSLVVADPLQLVQRFLSPLKHTHTHTFKPRSHTPFLSHPGTSSLGSSCYSLLIEQTPERQEIKDINISVGEIIQNAVPFFLLHLSHP